MKKLIKLMVAAVAGVAAILLLYAYAAYPAEYVNRLLRWGDSDVYDYQKFPARDMSASQTPFKFEIDLQDAAVIDQFNSMPAVQGDFEQFLPDTGTQAFIVIQDDAILYERYFNGGSHDGMVTSFSMAKSFTSALIGIAIGEGLIDSVNDPITDYLPELEQRDPAFSRITIRDLLLMSSGIRYQEFPFVNGDDAKTYYYPDLRDLALNQTEIAGPAGDAFLYNNYHPLLLGLILERATGMPVADYLEQMIWQPIGMAFDGSWSLDARGFEKMESGINGRAIDFAKFGRLFLRQGDWDGTEVIPEAWVQESTSIDKTLTDGYYGEHFREELASGFYKYMWWGVERPGEVDDFAALGNHGQFIYISPHKKLIIVRHGEKYGVNYPEWLRLFFDFATALEAPQEELSWQNFN